MGEICFVQNSVETDGDAVLSLAQDRHCENLLKCEGHQEGVEKAPWTPRVSGFCVVWASSRARRLETTEICSGKPSMRAL